MSLFDRVSRFIDDVILLPEDIRERLARAEDALEAKSHREAEDLFAEVLAQRPTIARAAVGLAQAREALGDVAGAREALDTARQLEPDDGEVALFAARLALTADDLDAAADLARAAASRYSRRPGPELVQACALRARAERKRGRPDRAVRELRKALAVASSSEEPSSEDSEAANTSLRVELVEALALAARPGGARAAAVGLDIETVDGADAIRVGLSLDRVGEREMARPWLQRGAEAGSDRALLLLSRYALDAGELQRAELLARRAVSRGAGAEALSLLAEVALAEGDHEEAFEALSAAASRAIASGHEDALELCRAAVRVADLTDVEALTRAADVLDRLGPDDPAATAARIWVALQQGATDVGALLEAAGDEPRAVLGRAATRIEDDPRAALVELDRWPDAAVDVPFASFDRTHAVELRRRALRALWRGPEGHVDLAAAIDAVERFAGERGFLEMQRAAGRLRDELDRPLLIAILGEFNAGKSTFVNAFVGADVAPTGIVPTTATLNVLRGGAERRVRVVRKDGTTREGSYDELKELLKAADGDDTHVDHVEIVLPAETLERIWILDTPGTNAIDEEHERLAKEAARRADAAIWIFDAAQAGKGTEAKMLEGLRKSRRVVVPVLNKADRLAPEELEQVRAVLAEDLGDVGDVVAISAREALRGRVDGDEERFERSGFAELLDRLERDVFSRSRPLKRSACAGRLLDTLDTAIATEPEAVARHDERIASLDALSDPLAASQGQLIVALDDAIGKLHEDLEGAYAEAAAEVLSFVRPRESRFASHGADREDQEFLADVLAQRLGTAADAFGRRLISRVRGTLAGSADVIGVPPQLLDARVQKEVYRSLALYVGIQRGVLRGGGLRRFFADVLPRATLNAPAIVEGLLPTRVDPAQELRPVLAEALSELVDGLVAERASEVAAQRRQREALVSGAYGPLRALREVLSELVAGAA